jgi:hypothetical protein
VFDSIFLTLASSAEFRIADWYWRVTGTDYDGYRERRSPNFIVPADILVFYDILILLILNNQKGENYVLHC